MKNFDGVTHILSCIPPDKNGNDPVRMPSKQLQIYPLNGLDTYLPQEYMEILKEVGFLR